MTVAVPTDGYGIYESSNSNLGQSTWGPRLTQIAAGGFKVVINYALLFGHIGDITAYINYASGLGLKVAVTLNDPAIWKTATYATKFPQLYADAGNPGTGTAFMQYVVNQTKNLTGVWGWYIGDELANSDHTTFAPYAAAVASADATHPRLIIESGSDPNSVASGTNLFYDSCEVLGDDYYPIGQPAGHYAYTTAQQAANIQSFDMSHSIQSVMALQGHSLAPYGITGAPWPTEAQMQQSRNDAQNNMAPRLLLWYSYFDVINTGSPDFAPAVQWSFLVNAVDDRSGTALFPTAKRRGSPQSYSTTILGDSPYAYYRLDDTGNMIYDSSGNGNQGIANTAGVTFLQPGAITNDSDTCILLNGTSGYLILPTAVNGSGWSAITVEAWIKPNAFPSSGNFANILDAGGGNNNYQFYIDSSKSLTFHVGNGTTNKIATYTLSSTGIWYYIVGIYNGANVLLYVNGVLQATSTSLTGTIGSSSTQPVVGANSGSHSSSFYSGYLDETAIYKNTALSTTQITTNYNTGLAIITGKTALFPITKRRGS